MGAPWYSFSSTSRGQAFLFEGVDVASDKGASTCTAATSADAQFRGESAYDYAGWSVAVGGDLNREGEGDVLIGAYGSDRGGSESGAAYVVLASH